MSQYHRMVGDFVVDGRPSLPAGFMSLDQIGGIISECPSVPLISRFAAMQMPDSVASLQRGEVVGDTETILRDIGVSMQEFQRMITTTMTGFPVRENLEAEAKGLVPTDTPVRNRLRREKGAGLASLWFQKTSMGGGYAPASTLASTASASATSVAVATGTGAQFAAGDYVIIGSGSTQEYKQVASVSTDTINLGVPGGATSALANEQAAAKPIVVVNRHPGSPQGLVRSFFAEAGAPAEHTETYVQKSASYKLLGTYGRVTGKAIAAGANFMNQLAASKTNAINNLMLNEEYALIMGDSTSTAAPWGDGTTALAFDGLSNLASTANGTPIDQIQTAVGALTTAHIDAQLRRLYNQGARGLWMVMNPQEVASLTHLAEGNGSIIRVTTTGADPRAAAGMFVTGYMNPFTGEMVDIVTSRFLTPGTILFMSDQLPDGTPTADVDVLPQVQLPELAPNESVQGYVAQELAPTHTAPQVYGFIVTCYEVLRLKSALHVAKSSGLTPV